MDGSPARLVREFHEKIGLPLSDAPGLPPVELARLRQKFLDEEVAEVTQAAEAGDLAGVAHELADVVYVAYGTALTYGIDLDAVIAEVHRANMTKSGTKGGKAMKGPGFVPPDLSGIVP
ncbi:MazG nucleotide pyrophosphohydrolase domain-containing protein [Streptosporangium amethystogenes subsp. fukuiense]|uniref:MazG nucleotide pyrophosphohydrolase domain-containing protein n=1 Tax=Streptosporangium amethystogenes subsp. fukuiense TaxID=698418 RepID=A0ABW2T9Z5_9ACTN